MQVLVIDNSATTKGACPMADWLFSQVPKVGKGTLLRSLLRRHPELYLAISVTTRSPVRAKSTENTITLSAAANLNKWLAKANSSGLSLPVLLRHTPFTSGEANFPRQVGCAGNWARRSTTNSQKFPLAISIFILPPSLTELERRIRIVVRTLRKRLPVVCAVLKQKLMPLVNSIFKLLTTIWNYFKCIEAALFKQC